MAVYQTTPGSSGVWLLERRFLHLDLVLSSESRGCTILHAVVHSQMWHRSQFAPSLQPFALRKYLQAAAQDVGWPAEPRDGKQIGSAPQASLEDEAGTGTPSQAG